MFLFQSQHFAHADITRKYPFSAYSGILARVVAIIVTGRYDKIQNPIRRSLSPRQVFL